MIEITRRRIIALAVAMVLVLGLSSAADSTSQHLVEINQHGAAINLSSTQIRFAAIGDYGSEGQSAADVAALVRSWNPEFIITLGDNNYDRGEASTIDANIGQYYHDFIGNYTGSYGPGASVNRFFPSLGNHDWHTPGAQPYLAYFSLPGNQRYYNFTWGPIEFFALDSDDREPDGITATSPQASWLHSQLSASNARWKLVYFHHPSYSSGYHGSKTDLQWPFKEWGADAVLTGHDHLYERIIHDDIPYFVNGLGGKSNIYSFGRPLDGSMVRFNGDFGAMLIEADSNQIRFQFITRGGVVIDDYSLSKPAAEPSVEIFLPLLTGND